MSVEVYKDGEHIDSMLKDALKGDKLEANYGDMTRTLIVGKLDQELEDERKASLEKLYNPQTLSLRDFTCSLDISAALIALKLAKKDIPSWGFRAVRNVLLWNTSAMINAITTKEKHIAYGDVFVDLAIQLQKTDYDRKVGEEVDKLKIVEDAKKIAKPAINPVPSQVPAPAPATSLFTNLLTLFRGNPSPGTSSTDTSLETLKKGITHKLENEDIQDVKLNIKANTPGDNISAIDMYLFKKMIEKRLQKYATDQAHMGRAQEVNTENLLPLSKYIINTINMFDLVDNNDAASYVFSLEIRMRDLVSIVTT